jgi:hypothetical protein
MRFRASRTVLHVLLAAAAAAAVTAAGCNRRQPPAAKPAAAAPTVSLPAGVKAADNLACKLLSKSDAAELLGGDVKPPLTSITFDIGQSSSRCAYISEATHPATKVLALLAQHWEQPDAARQAFERAHVLSQTVSGAPPETIEGLGDRAYWAGGKVNQLNVLAGSTWLVISDTQGPGLDQQAPARAAAAKILSHQ